MSGEGTQQDRDGAQLAALGIESHFDRSMTLWQNFALGFTYLSPVVGVYTLFGYSVKTAGPPAFWAYILVGIGQFLVALIFGEVVSQFPIAGGVYPWTRRLVGKRWAWMAAWIYGWALFILIAAVAVGTGPYLALLLGFANTPQTVFVTALALVALCTILNLSGTRLLSRVAMLGFVCELAGAVVVGIFLLGFHRHQSITVLFDTFGSANGGSYLPAFLAAAMGGFFLYGGFEACGDVAEETPNPSVLIPRAMRMTIYIGGAAAVFVCLALILAIPDVDKVVHGDDADPIGTILISAMGDAGARVFMMIIMVSFLSCLLSLQAAVSRLVFSFARDDMILFSHALRKLSPKTHVPGRALLLAGAIPALIVCLNYISTSAMNTIASSATIGVYLSFLMVVLGALVARRRGWRPAGAFQLGAIGPAVNIAALLFQIAAIVDMAWPRSPRAPWYENYGIIVTVAAVLAGGLAYMLGARPYERGPASSGDAWRPQGTGDVGPAGLDWPAAPTPG